MSNFAALIATIQANIKTNGNEEITGAVLQDVLEAMVQALGTEAINNLETALGNEETARRNADGAINAKIPAEASSSNKLADKAFVTGLTTALQTAINTINEDIGNGYVYAGIATPSGTPVSGKVFYLARQAGTYTNFGGLTLTEGVNVLKYNGTAWSQEQLISIADIYRNPLMGYYECDTAGATAAKTVAATGYVLPTTGGSVKIKMANRNSVADATLNINSTGAKPLYYNGQRAGVGNTWDTNEIVVVYYDGTNYQAYNVAGSNGDGVFDISAYNLTDGQPTPYVDLAAALGTNGEHVPQSLRKGGMSVKFIQGSVPSSDNKYVQYRLMADEWSTTETDWQGVDEAPIAGSDNLVKSGGVFKASTLAIEKQKMTVDFSDGGVKLGEDVTIVNAEDLVQLGVYEHIVIDVKEGEQYVIRGLGGSTNLMLWATTIRSSDPATNWLKSRVSEPSLDTVSEPIVITILENETHLIINNNKENNDCASVYKVNPTFQKQIDDMAEDAQDLHAEDNAIHTEIDKIKEVCVWEEGAINIGDYNILNNVEASGTYNHTVIDVKAGEQYAIRGLGTTTGTKYLLWATTRVSSDSQYYKNRYSNSQDSVTTPVIVTIQSGENHLIVNNQKANANVAVYKLEDSIQKQINDMAWLKEEFSIQYELLGDGVNTNFGVINPLTLIGNSNFKHIILDVKEGEQYVIKGCSMSENAVLWATTRHIDGYSDYVVNRKSPVNQTGDDFVTVTIQQGENHLLVNNDMSKFPNFRIYKVQDNTESDLAFRKLELRNGYSIVTNGTSWNACGTASDYACRVVKCKQGDRFRFVGNGASSARLWATIDKNGEIRRVAATNVIAANFNEIVIAEGETAFIFNAKTNVSIIPELYYCGSTDINIVSIASGAEGAGGSSQSDKDKADYIFTNGAGKLTNFILTPGVTLSFSEGTYDVASAINFTDGSSFVGNGTVTFDRSNNASAYVFLPQDNSASNVSFKGISFNRRTYAISHSTAQVSNLKLENVSFVGSDYTINIVDGLVINDVNDGNQHFTVGVGKNFPNLMQAYRYNRAQPSTKMCVYHIYGHSVITEFDNNAAMSEETLTFAIPSVFIGETKDATVEILSNYKAPRFVAGYQTNNDPNYSVFRNIRFLRTGIIDAYNIDCFTVYSDHCRFYDCIFENQTKSPVPFDNDTDPYTPTNSINPHGDRRHGAFISNQLYDSECELEFYNCKGIGSPYGFKNTRGWYITTGSARLYNCIGIGGGIGERGYGIICHRQSKPILYNCIGHGSPYGARLCNGIQFQANAIPLLNNCIAFGGTGYKWESVEVDGEIVYRQKTPAVLSTENHGLCCMLSPFPTLVECVGYAGDGDGSAALWFDHYSKPKVVGGLYGKERKIWYSYYTPDSGQTYMTISLGNKDRDIYLDGIYLADGENITYDGSLKVQVLVGGSVIAEAVWNTQELEVPIATPLVSANAVVTWRFVNVSTGNPVNLSTGQRAKLTVRWRVNNQMMCACLRDHTKPFISNVTFDGNENSDGIAVNNVVDNTWLISKCTVKSTRKSVFATSEKSNVPVVDCVFTADTDNIVSFKATAQVLESTNIKV